MTDARVFIAEHMQVFVEAAEGGLARHAMADRWTTIDRLDGHPDGVERQIAQRTLDLELVQVDSRYGNTVHYALTDAARGHLDARGDEQ